MFSQSSRSNLWLTGVLIVTGILSSAKTLSAQGHVCTREPAFYGQNKYVVHKITIETPLSAKIPLSGAFGLESNLRSFLDEVKSDLPLKEGEPFDNLDYGLTNGRLAQRFGQLRTGDRFRAAYPIPRLEHCDDTRLILDVVYRVYTTDYVSYLSRLFEAQPDKITRSLLPGRLSDKNKVLPAPFVGYNRSRGIFGGGRLTISTPAGPLRKTVIAATASSSSLTTAVALAGSRDFAGFLDRAEWSLNHTYTDIPSDTLRRKSGALKAQSSISTKPIQNVALRFGGSVEGGHYQTEFVEPSHTVAPVPNSAYGALRMYSGATMRSGRQSLKASYGLQLGQTGKEVRVDYIKQVVDSAYNARILPRDHMPLRVDAQFSAGWMHSNSGLLPAGELFYGGNVQRNFIQGDSWMINSAPFIRSFPQDRFSRTGPQQSAGATRFFSLNLTLAQTIWKYPLVPEELLHDPSLSTQLKVALHSQLENQRGQVEMGLLSEEAKYKELEDQVKPLDTNLKEIKDAFEMTSPASLSSGLAETRQEVMDCVDNAGSLTSAFLDPKTKDLSQIIDLVVPFKLDSGDIPSTIQTCIDALKMFLDQVTGPALAPLKTRLQGLREKLDSQQSQALQKYEDLLSLLKLDAEELSPAQAPLDDLAKSLNRVEMQLAGIESKLQNLPVSSPDRIEEFRDRLASAEEFASKAKEGIPLARKEETARRDLNLLSGGYEVAIARLAGLTKAVRDLRGFLMHNGMAGEWKLLENEAATLDKLRGEIHKAMGRIHYSTPQLKAATAVDYSGHMLDTIFRELNLAAVSPVAMFDVAHLGPRTDSLFDPTRYGLGAGVRFSMLSVDVTGGYEWNLNRRADEKRGAFLFTMDISDLFR